MNEMVDPSMGWDIFTLKWLGGFWFHRKMSMAVAAGLRKKNDLSEVEEADVGSQIFLFKECTRTT